MGRQSRRTRRDRGHAPHAPHVAMALLARLWAGDTLTVVDATIRLVNVEDPFDRLVVAVADLDDLESRGWILPPTDDSRAVVTRAGRAALAAWYARRHPNARAVTNRLGDTLALRA